MYNTNNSALSKDDFFEAKNHTNINSISNCNKSLEETNKHKVRKALKKALFTPREVMQVLANLEAMREAIKIFKQRNATKLPKNISEIPKFHEVKAENIELSDSTRQMIARLAARRSTLPAGRIVV